MAVGVMLVGAVGVWWYVRSEPPPCVAGLRVDGFEETHRWYDRVEDVSRTYLVGPVGVDPIQAFHLHQVKLRDSPQLGSYGAYDAVASGYQPEGVTPSASVVVYRLGKAAELRDDRRKLVFERADLSDAQRAAVQNGTATILLVEVLCA
ncbi:hypothetical protein ACQEVZ_44390 [Dactylosporangium sp. CA-152071]|uniref:hypothetical protein n=1 Tax=Dactylosporangium sp. CA-152071 TaxID=3239933 RepID=UPI003D8AA03D